MAARGLLFVLDGPEGGGKSTQAEMLAAYLRGRGRRVVVLREPGGTALGEALRDLLLAPGGPARIPLAELFLFLAARAELVATRVRPALAAGEDVVLDRYYYATLAYQVAGWGQEHFPPDVERLVRCADGGLEPVRAFFLLVPPAVAAARRRGGPDRIEGRPAAFHARVLAAYEAMAQKDPERIRVVDASRPPAAVAAAIREEVDRVLGPP